MVESSRLVFKLLCVKLKSLNFDFLMDTTTQFNLHLRTKRVYYFRFYFGDSSTSFHICFELEPSTSYFYT